MLRPPSRYGSVRLALVAALLPGVLCGKGLSVFALGQSSTAAPAVVTSSKSDGVSLAEYQARLKSMDQLLAGCQQAMLPANCQSDRVGSDLQLALPAGARSIRFAWVRDLLDRVARDGAAKPDASKQVPVKQDSGNQNLGNQNLGKQNLGKQDRDKKGSGKQDEEANPSNAADSEEDLPLPAKPVVQFQEPTLLQQLAEARQRLGEEALIASRLASQSSLQATSQAGQANAHGATADDGLQRATLNRILAEKEYHAAVASPTLVERVLEKVGNWINRFFGKLAEAGFKSKWIGYTAEIGFVLLLCIGLVWFLIRLERQGRMGMANIRIGPSADAASARDWQLWLRDARSAAAQGAWRDAIHLLYWASISRLESSGQWPADRARTPREYLALLSPESAQRPELARLTRSFERTWYAGRTAEESDFRAAEQVASKLGISPGGQ